MLNLELPEPNSRRGYPELSGNRLILHDEPQYEGQIFLPGYTFEDLGHFNRPIPYKLDSDQEVPEDIQSAVIWREGGWQIHEKFEYFEAPAAMMVAACLEYPMSKAVESWQFDLAQNRGRHGGSTHLKAGTWHFDYPWNIQTGWWGGFGSGDTTEFSLEEHRAISGLRIDDVSPESIWRPEQGEAFVVGALTAHRRPRVYRRNAPRNRFSLEPQYTRAGKPKKSRPSMLETVNIGDYSNVPIDYVERVA